MKYDTLRNSPFSWAEKIANISLCPTQDNLIQKLIITFNTKFISHNFLTNCNIPPENNATTTWTTSPRSATATTTSMTTVLVVMMMGRHTRRVKANIGSGFAVFSSHPAEVSSPASPELSFLPNFTFLSGTLPSLLLRFRHRQNYHPYQICITIIALSIDIVTILFFVVFTPR